MKIARFSVDGWDSYGRVEDDRVREKNRTQPDFKRKNGRSLILIFCANAETVTDRIRRCTAPRDPTRQQARNSVLHR